MLSSRFAVVDHYPFRQLAELLDGTAPAANLPPVDMSVGEPRHQPPEFLHEIVARNGTEWNRYPALVGTPEFLAACAAWLTRRYRLPAGMIDARTQIAPVAGTREGLFSAALLAISPATDGQKPVALMPNPFYQVYYGASIFAGAEPVFLPATRETGFLPDLEAIDPAILERTQLFYLCSPGEPAGRRRRSRLSQARHRSGTQIRLPARRRRVLWRDLYDRAAAVRRARGGCCPRRQLR
jgi:N-succinyldiaminopimelate aminotransferase